MKLSGKVAIVTGSSRGIGKAIAIALARAGADVVVAERSEEAKKDLAGTIGETAAAIRALGRRALAVRCDVGDEESVNQMVQRALQELGRVDVLVNNAAVGYFRPFMQIEPRHWDLVMRVNTKGPFLCCRAVLPQMIAQGGGSIVNISSNAAAGVYSQVKHEDGRPRVTGVLYGASKAALDRLSRGLAAEVAENNIAVNSLRPAAVTWSEGMLLLNRDVVAGSYVMPEVYMTKAAVFLAQQDGRGITGQAFDDQTLCR